MADQANIFGTEQTPATTGEQGVGSTTPNAQDHAALTDLLGSIKNERGEPKYKTIQDALVGLANAQTHISTLTAEQRARDEEIERLRTGASKLTELESTVQQLLQRQQEASATSGGSMTQADIANLVTRTLEINQTKAQETANVRSVVAKMKEVFGDKASDVFYAKGQELGLSADAVNQLAAKSPTAVLKMLGVSEQASTYSGAPNSGTINAGGFTPRQNSHVGRNKESFILGATTEDFARELNNARSMVEELHAAGLSVDDLTNPKTYKKYFG